DHLFRLGERPISGRERAPVPTHSLALFGRPESRGADQRAVARHLFHERAHLVHEPLARPLAFFFLNPDHRKESHRFVSLAGLLTAPARTSNQRCPNRHGRVRNPPSLFRYRFRCSICATKNFFSASFVSPSCVASSSALSVAQPSTIVRFMSHIPA